MKKNNISEPVIPRILNYLRVSQQLEREKVVTVSSEEMARLTNNTASQVRKDLANFGKFGKPRVGYNVSDLKLCLEKSVNGKGTCKLVLVGVGNLGIALLKYAGFKNDGLKVVAAFDKDKTKMGKMFSNIKIKSMDKLKSVVAKGKIDIGIIAVPEDCAQSVANQLIGAGILSILNFAPKLISVPPQVTLRNVDLSNELKALRFFSARH